MKGFIAFFLVALVGASASRCPVQQTEELYIELLLPHPDCNKFFKCTNGEPVEQSCPEGLLYNHERLQCDYPTNVQCGRQEPELSSQEEVRETVYHVAEDISFLPNGCPVDSDIHWLVPSRWCNLYYSCVSGRRVRMNCPRGLHFNRDVQVCDYPERAGCRRH